MWPDWHPFLKMAAVVWPCSIVSWLLWWREPDPWFGRIVLGSGPVLSVVFVLLWLIGV